MAILEAGKAFIKFSLDDIKVRKGLEKLQHKFSKVGAGMQKMGAVGIGVGGAIATGFVPAVMAASRMQETMGKFETVFGEDAKSVKAWGDQYGESVGRSKQQVADFLSSTQDLLVPIGFDDTKAQETSKQLVQLAVDLASFNNASDADTMRDLQAALTGSSEVMNKYGVMIRKAGIDQELFNMSINPKEATNAQKAQATLNIIMRGTTAAQGDAIKTSGSFANQMKRLWAIVDNVAVELGDHLLPIITPIVQQLGDAAKVVGAWIAENKTLVTWIAYLAGGLVIVGGVLVTVGTAFAVISTAIGGLTAAFGVIAPVLAGFGTVIGFLTTAFGVISAAVAGFASFIGSAGAALALVANPIGLVIALIGGLVAWFLTSTETGQRMTESLKAGWASAWSFMGRMFQIAIGGIKHAWAATVAFFQRTWAKIKGFFGADVKSEIEDINNAVEGASSIASANIKIKTLTENESRARRAASFGGRYAGATARRGDSRNGFNSSSVGLGGPEVKGIKGTEENTKAMLGLTKKLIGAVERGGGGLVAT